MSLFRGQTILVTLEEFEDIIDDDRFQVDLLLVIQVFGFELDLWEDEILGNTTRLIRNTTNQRHVDICI